MKQVDDFLLEIQTEELPPKSLRKTAETLCAEISNRLLQVGLTYSSVNFFATPRRLAVLVQGLPAQTAEHVVERRGPALQVAYDKAGTPTPACIGFAKSCGISVDGLIRIKTEQGEWVGGHVRMPGKAVTELLPELVKDAISVLPIQRPMHWGTGSALFLRPVVGVVMLYGEDIVSATILGCQAGRTTLGHRVLSPDPIVIPHASLYASLLSTAGFVLTDFAAREKLIKTQAEMAAAKISPNARAMLDSALLEEVTGLVEWPNAVVGQFDAEFLKLPREVLISAMQDHQRYFPVSDQQGKLLPYFICISNTDTKDMRYVISGNERVLRARLADAQFFYEVDRKVPLADRVASLQGMIYQAKLGTLLDKANRLAHLTKFVGCQILGKAAEKNAARAGLLAKADLTTQMVGEFPGLQGVMGYYYALDSEPMEIAEALREQYLPRFAGDHLPKHNLGKALALADRIDTIIGAFGIKQIPTGDKDPYGLRRSAIGIVRIIIEEKIDLDFQALLEEAKKHFTLKFEDNVTEQVFNFIIERMRVWYHDQGITPDVFASVTALNLVNLLDIDARIHAVKNFKTLEAAASLSIANKRVTNILAKYPDQISIHAIEPAYFEDQAEAKLADLLTRKAHTITALNQKGKYSEALLQLAELKMPVDDFFDHVMVMVDDKTRRENRLLLLTQLRSLFLQVADIALLQH